jgi:hypothetical protein
MAFPRHNQTNHKHSPPRRYRCRPWLALPNIRHPSAHNSPLDQRNRTPIHLFHQHFEIVARNDLSPPQNLPCVHRVPNTHLPPPITCAQSTYFLHPFYRTQHPHPKLTSLAHRHLHHTYFPRRHSVPGQSRARTPTHSESQHEFG